MSATPTVPTEESPLDRLFEREAKIVRAWEEERIERQKMEWAGRRRTPFVFPENMGSTLKEIQS